MTVSIHVRPRLWASVAGCALTTTIFALPPSAFGAEVLTFDGTSLAGAIAAYDVSDNGTVVVGSFTISSHQHAFRLDGTVFQDLGTIGQTGEASVATGVSADGAVVVGYSYNSSSIAHAFRWTTTAPMADLGFLRDGTYSYARAVSADGAVVVGDSETTGHVDHAFRWSVGHMVDLGTLGGTTSVANDVSADGGVVVGYSTVAGSAAAHAFRWSGGSMVDINGTNSSSIAKCRFGRRQCRGWICRRNRSQSGKGIPLGKWRHAGFGHPHRRTWQYCVGCLGRRRRGCRIQQLRAMVRLTPSVGRQQPGCSRSRTC